MRIIVALGGNALLQRGEALTAENQRKNIRKAAQSLAELAKVHDIIITHGNGPQVGLLALQSAAYKPQEAYPLDVLGAESFGMIGYMIEQELGNIMPQEQRFATLLTMVEVDPNDKAFDNPTKPIGPFYNNTEALKIQKEKGWVMKMDSKGTYRRVVPSPIPQRIFELNIIEMLIKQKVIVICTGGGGIPVMYEDNGMLTGVEAVIDKDRSSSLLAQHLKADALLILTDVHGVAQDWGTPNERWIAKSTPARLKELDFATGSMGPKVNAACRFVEDTGGVAGIGRLEDALDILAGLAGTLITNNVQEKTYR